MASISVVVIVYNEEERIRRVIQSFYKYDEIVIVNKSSTDKTADIARGMGVKVVDIAYSDNMFVLKAGSDQATSDWVFFATCSDVVHPLFTKQLYDLVNQEGFGNKYNRIEYPCIMHVLGIESKNSVYDSMYRRTIIKRKDLVIIDQVHLEMYAKNEVIYRIPFDRDVALHHLSHESLEVLYERSLRYTKEEMKHGITYNYAFKYYLKQIVIGMRKGFWKLGWKGFFLMMSLANYGLVMMGRCVEREMGDIKGQYNEYAKKMLALDDNDFKNKEYEEKSKIILANEVN